MNRSILWLAVVALVAGCSSNPNAPGSDPNFLPAYPEVTPPPVNNSGSIFQEQTALSLFSDAKPRRVGDILTVQLVEKTRAQKKADNQINKNSSQEMADPSILGTGVQFNLPGLIPLANNQGLNLGVSANANRQFKGSSLAEQSNTLEGGITVTVARIFENGNLLIRGEKWLTLNQGSEFVRLSGIVRPDDISTDNLVLSTRIANANISYSGTGSFAESNEMGWLSNFFNSGWWPF